MTLYRNEQMFNEFSYVFAYSDGDAHLQRKNLKQTEFTYYVCGSNENMRPPCSHFSTVDLLLNALRDNIVRSSEVYAGVNLYNYLFHTNGAANWKVQRCRGEEVVQETPLRDLVTIDELKAGRRNAP